jgi:hypothetical protein
MRVMNVKQLIIDSVVVFDKLAKVLVIPEM